MILKLIQLKKKLLMKTFKTTFFKRYNFLKKCVFLKFLFWTEISKVNQKRGFFFFLFANVRLAREFESEILERQIMHNLYLIFN